MPSSRAIYGPPPYSDGRGDHLVVAMLVESQSLPFLVFLPTSAGWLGVAGSIYWQNMPADSGSLGPYHANATYSCNQYNCVRFCSTSILKHCMSVLSLSDWDKWSKPGWGCKFGWDCFSWAFFTIRSKKYWTFLKVINTWRNTKQIHRIFIFLKEMFSVVQQK